MKIKVSLLTLMILLMLSGCAYFNTYYNAQEKFNLAEEEYSNLENSKNFPRGLTQNYEAVTVKSFKVIENFPESKWVDNAMYLFGISNYRLENYRVARKMFRRLTMEYPQSGYYQEAKLWIARCTYMNNEKKLAFEMLESFTENKANDMFFGDAMLLYAQLAIEENDLEKADMAYLRAISLIKNKNRKADFHYEYAIYLINVERLDEALTHLESIEKLSLNRDLLAKVQLQYAKIFRLQKDYSGSEELLKNMLANEKYIDIYSDLQLELAQIYRSMNDYSRAIERNKTIIVDYPNTPNAAVAAYRIAEMYLYDLGDMDKAGEYYKNTTKQDKNSFESSEAKKVIRIINQFATQQKTIKILEKNTPQLTEEPLKYYLAMKDSAAVDSLSAVNLKAYIPVAENYIKELITRGESLSFTFFLYDSSLSIYESIAENFPFSSSLARVLYIRAWVNENELKDVKMADSLYSLLISEYPDSRWAKIYKGEKDEEIEIYEKDQAKLFSIEEKLSNENNSAALIKYFLQVIPELKDTTSLSQAWHYIAWLYDNELTNLDSALVYYQTVVDSFPASYYSESSRKRVLELMGMVNETLMSDSSSTSGE